MTKARNGFLVLRQKKMANGVEKTEKSLKIYKIIFKTQKRKTLLKYLKKMLLLNRNIS